MDRNIYLCPKPSYIHCYQEGAMLFLHGYEAGGKHIMILILMGWMCMYASAPGVTINSGNALAPVPFQAITLAIFDLIGNCTFRKEIYLCEIWLNRGINYIPKKAFENAVCNISSVLFRPWYDRGRMVWFLLLLSSDFVFWHNQLPMLVNFT